MLEIRKKDNKLLLIYAQDFGSQDWLDEKISEKKSHDLKRVFNVNSKILTKKLVDESVSEFPEYHFEIGIIEDDYYKLDAVVFGIENRIYLHESIDFKKEHFLVSDKISIIAQIDSLVNEDVFIGGEKENNLPIEEFEKLIKTFPNSHEVKLYRRARVHSILKDYFKNRNNEEKRYNDYLNKKIPIYESQIRKTFKEEEIAKYSSLLEKLDSMLKNETNYSEHQWQQEILQIVLLLFPKYIAVFPEVRFKDIYNGKVRKLDFGLIDAGGYLDLIEIKKPFDSCLVSKGIYRDNHIPKRDLSGTIMQIEKYIFYLNKAGQKEEKKLTQMYQDKLPQNLEIKITNPNGMIIMGRDNNLTQEQQGDFEIIKRKYKNLIDILTYDDLLRRLNMIIEQLRKI